MRRRAPRPEAHTRSVTIARVPRGGRLRSSNFTIELGPRSRPAVQPASLLIVLHVVVVPRMGIEREPVLVRPSAMSWRKNRSPSTRVTPTTGAWPPRSRVNSRTRSSNSRSHAVWRERACRSSLRHLQEMAHGDRSVGCFEASMGNLSGPLEVTGHEEGGHDPVLGGHLVDGRPELSHLLRPVDVDRVCRSVAGHPP